MALSNAQKGGFEDRLARIKQGGPNTVGEVHVGPANVEEVRSGKNKSKVKIKKKRKSGAGTTGTAIYVVFGLMFGAIAMFAGKAAEFHMLAPGGLVPLEFPEVVAPALPYAQFIVASLLGLMLAWTFRLTTKVRFIAVIAGAYALFHFHSDLVGQYPAVHANFFTEAYVAETLASA